jgi:hypothetical protein
LLYKEHHAFLEACSIKFTLCDQLKPRTCVLSTIGDASCPACFCKRARARAAPSP